MSSHGVATRHAQRKLSLGLHRGRAGRDQIARVDHRRPRGLFGHELARIRRLDFGHGLELGDGLEPGHDPSEATTFCGSV